MFLYVFEPLGPVSSCFYVFSGLLGLFPRVFARFRASWACFLVFSRVFGPPGPVSSCFLYVFGTPGLASSCFCLFSGLRGVFSFVFYVFPVSWACFLVFLYAFEPPGSVSLCFLCVCASWACLLALFLFFVCVASGLQGLLPCVFSRFRVSGACFLVFLLVFVPPGPRQGPFPVRVRDLCVCAYGACALQGLCVWVYGGCVLVCMEFGCLCV